MSAVVMAMPGTVSARLAATGVLLERPPCIEPEICHTVYGLRGGRVGTAPLAHYRLPAVLRDTVAVMPGPTSEDGIAILPELARMAHRMAPWLRVDIAPEILTARKRGDDFARGGRRWLAGGREYAGASGLACTGCGMILMDLRCPAAMVDTLAHEIMHFFWKHHLSKAARRVLAAAVSGGPR